MTNPTQQSNGPPVIVELTQEEAKFLIDNCESNIIMGLQALQTTLTSKDLMKKVINLNDCFKTIRDKIMKASQ